MKRNLFWLFLFTCSLSWADNVPVSKAEQLARNFFGIHETTRAGDSMQLEYIWDGEDVQTRERPHHQPFMFLIVHRKEVLSLLRVMM